MIFMRIVLMLLMIVAASCAQEPQQQSAAPETATETAVTTLEPADRDRTPLDEVRIDSFDIAMQCWTFHKFTFMETLPKVAELGVNYLQAYPGQVIDAANPDVKMGPGLSADDRQRVRDALKEYDIRLVSFGVTGFENTEESMRSTFDFARDMGIRVIITEPQWEDWSLLEKMVKEYNIRVAIHNHPEPSKYAHPETVLKKIYNLDDRIGVCADTGHWLRTNVDPVEALRMLYGRIIDVHLKDLPEKGNKDAHDVPFGQGVSNVHDVLAELSLQNYTGYLTVEHENPDELDNPGPSILKGIEYIDSITYYKGYTELLSHWDGLYNKQGWNHYGPGYFELDERSGILKSHKGMGLFWYSAHKYRDFILELDYKTEVANANSGVFYRIPDMPVSNDYIFNSFEVQIDDSQEGIHQTGSIYDAEAPKTKAFKPTGEWNHYKIILNGGNVKVELNGTVVNDWNMEPRGKIRSFSRDGYIGLQNHDYATSVYFKNIYIKELN